MRQAFTGIVVQTDVGVDPRVPVTFTTPAGETGQIDLTVVTQAGAAYDLTGASLTLSVRLGSQLLLSRGGTINSPSTGGTAFFPLVIADTVNLSNNGLRTSYTFDIWVTDASGNRFQVISGTSQFVVLASDTAPGQPVTVPTTQIPPAYNQIQSPPGTNLPLRSIFSFDGNVLGATDNPGALRTDVAMLAQAANLVLAGPTSGGSGAPTFRALVAADLPGSSNFLPLTGGTMSGSIALDGFTAIANAATYDLSAGTGTFKTPTGAATFGGSSNAFTNSVAFNGGATASGSTAFDLSGSTGAFKVPTGAATFGGTSNTFNGTNTSGGLVSIAPGAASSGTQGVLALTSPASTSQTAATEISGVLFNLSATRSWASGAIAKQRELRIQNPTYAFAGASTVTLAATVAIDGPPLAGSNATLTEPVDLLLQYNGIGANSTVGTAVALSLQNTTAAANGAQQFSPMIELVAQGWGTTGGTSQTVATAIQFQSVQGTTPTGKWVFLESINGSAYTPKWFLSDGGTLEYQTTLTNIVFGNAITYNGTSSVGNHQLTSTQTLSTAGTYLVSAFDSGGGNLAGVLFFGLASGGTHLFCEGEALTCSGTVSVGQVVVWSGTNQVSAAAATVNLTTIAGVAVTGGTNAIIKIARRGRCLVNADASITAGQMVSTSSATAGNCQSGTTPVFGALLGRATEATGGTVAGQVTVDLILG